MAYAKIRPRRGTLYEWSTYNPVLASGELALEYPDSGVGSGLCKFKIGDGLTAYTNLPYAFDGTAANSINGGTPTAYSIIQLRAADTATWSDINPVLNENEIIYDKTVNSFKVGDGINRFDDLPYISSNLINEEYDFIDEDLDDIVGVAGSEHRVLNNNYPENVLPDNWRDNIDLDNNEDVAVGTNETDTYNTEESTAGIEDLLSEPEEDKEESEDASTDNTIDDDPTGDMEDDVEDGGSEDDE